MSLLRISSYSCLMIAFSIALSSCYHTKDISYFQDSGKYEKGQTPLQSLNNYQVKIQSDNELQIIVSTALNPETAAPFNLSPVVSQKASTTSVANGATYQSYLVDTEGNITIPSLGKVKVAGLTTEEATQEIENKLKVYLKDPIVTLRLLSFKINVLGEVNSPGEQYFDRQKVTILDAIAKARDLSIYAQRDSIKLIREEDGKRIFYVYDLTKSDFLSSPYYYLKPNDVLYAVPNKERQGDAHISQQKQYRTSLTMSVVSLTLGIVSTVATIFAITK